MNFLDIEDPFQGLTSPRSEARIPDLTCKSPIVAEVMKSHFGKTIRGLNKKAVREFSEDFLDFKRWLAQESITVDITSFTWDHTFLFSWLRKVSLPEELTVVPRYYIEMYHRLTCSIVRKNLRCMGIVTDYRVSDRLPGPVLELATKEWFIEAFVFGGLELFGVSNANPVRTKDLVFKTSRLKIIVLGNLIFAQSKTASFCWNRSISSGVGTVRDSMTLLATNQAERTNLVYSGFLAREINQPHYLTDHEALKMLTFGDVALDSLNNDGYKWIKFWEPLCVGSLLKASAELYMDKNKFLNQILLQISEDTTGAALLPRTTDGAVKFLSKLSIQKVTQAFGMYRIWGHPAVDPIPGIRKLKGIACKVKHPLHETIADVTNKFKESFSISFHRSHGRWPNHRILTHKTNTQSYLLNCLRAGMLVNRHRSDYHLSDWRFVTFSKNLTYDPVFNLTSLLTDKALSPTERELYTAHIKSRSPPPHLKRVLLRWLDTDLVTVKEVIDLLNSGELSDDQYIIGVCPKERELKTEPRLFALQTLIFRIYGVMTEHFIAEHLLKYFPQITMTYSQTELDFKIKTETKSMGFLDDNLATVTTNIDFEKWNSNMRDEVVNPIFTEIDNLFGLSGIFSRTHEFFTKSTIYLCTGLFDLEYDERGRLKENDWTWKNHLGGFEGLRQKGWTIVTLCAIMLAADPVLDRYTIMGQGDNQVIMARISKEPNARFGDQNPVAARHAEFMKGLDKVFTQLCLPIKLAESWASTCLYMYSKAVYYQGCPVPMSQKRLARAFTLANDLHPTLENAISVIFCNANSAALADYSSLIPFHVAVFRALMCFGYHLESSPMLGRGLKVHAWETSALWRSVENIGGLQHTRSHYIPPKSVRFLLQDTETLLEILLLTPKVLGGYPVQCIYSFSMRGFPDPLVEWLCFLKNYYRISSPKLQSLILSLLDPLFANGTEYRMLVQDPVSVNLVVPTSGGMQLRNKISQWLPNYPIKNKFFKEIVQWSQSDEDFCQQLVGGDSVWPRVLHGLYDSTVFGYCRSLARRITHTNTIAAVARDSAAIRGNSIVRSAEGRYFNSVLWRLLRSDMKDFPYQCSMQYAKELRDKSWRITILGVGTPHPFELFNWSVVGPEGCIACQVTTDGYIKVSRASTFPEWERLTRTLGPIDPYIGSVTREKIPQHANYSPEVSTPFFQKVIRMVRVLSWFATDHLKDLIIRHFESVCDLPVDLFMLPEGVISGSPEHRYHDGVLSAGGYICQQYTASSYNQICTTTLQKYAKGSKNVTLHFQAVFCTTLSKLSLSTALNYQDSLPPACVHLHIDCLSCIHELPPPEVKGYPGLDLITFPDIKDNRLLLPLFPEGKIPESYPIATLTSHPKRLELLNILAIELVCNWRRMEYDLSHQSDSYTDIPVVWLWDIDIVSLLELFLTNLYSSSIIFLLRHNTQVPELYEVFCKTLIDAPLQLFQIFLASYYDSNGRESLVRSFYNFPAPTSIPFTKYSVLRALRIGIINMVNSSYFYNKLHWYIQSNLPVSIDPKQTRVSILTLFGREVILHPQKGDDMVRDFAAWDTLAMADEGDLTLSRAHQHLARVASAKYLINLTLTRPEGADVAVKTLKILYPVIDPRFPDKYCPLSAFPNAVVFVCAGTVSDSILDQSTITPYISDQSGYSIQMLRSAGFYSSSAYRWGPMFKEVNISPKFAVVLADGTGGVSALLLTLFPEVRLFFNTLIDADLSDPLNTIQCVPPAFSHIPSWSTRVIHLNLTTDYCSDLTSSKMLKVAHQISNHYSPDLVVMDLEGPLWNDNSSSMIKVFSSINQFLHRSPADTRLIVKCFFGNVTLINGLQRWFRRRFHSVRCYRAILSSKSSSEFFLVGSDFAGSSSDQLEFVSSGWAETLWNSLKQVSRAQDPTTIKDAGQTITTLLSSTGHYQSILANMRATFPDPLGTLSALALAIRPKPHSRIHTMKYWTDSLRANSTQLTFPVDTLWELVLKHMTVISSLSSPQSINHLSLIEKLFEEGTLICYLSTKSEICSLLVTNFNKEGHHPQLGFFARRLKNMTDFHYWSRDILTRIGTFVRQGANLEFQDVRGSYRSQHIHTSNSIIYIGMNKSYYPENDLPFL